MMIKKTHLLQRNVSFAPTKILDMFPPQECRRHESYMRTVDAGLVNDGVEATTKVRGEVWEEWHTHCRYYGVSPYLDECSFEEVARTALNFCGKLLQGRGRNKK